MNAVIDQTQLHRTAKIFMDSGRAATHQEALAILYGFRLNVLAGPEVGQSIQHQQALLSLVNAGRRTFLGGVFVSGPTAGPLLAHLADGLTLGDGIEALGGQIADAPDASSPLAVIGNPPSVPPGPACWQLTWQGWRGGVVPIKQGIRLTDYGANPLTPVLAASVCAAEVFAWCAGDHAMAGKRSAGLSLWRPGAPWLSPDLSEPQISLLPSRLWLIGLGNLGQAYAWLLACLPYKDAAAVELVLQDFDTIAESNDSTSLLSTKAKIGIKKTRVVGAWLERRGFNTTFEERRFGSWSNRMDQEPGVALCGVDNALARADLDKAGFDLVVESGLGGGPDGFRNFSVHTFPASRRSEQVWPRHMGARAADVSLPAYSALRAAGLDECGLAQLASRTVGVPFVGLLAGTLVMSELLRRLHGAEGIEQISGSLFSLDDLEVAKIGFSPYPGSFVETST